MVFSGNTSVLVLTAYSEVGRLRWLYFLLLLVLYVLILASNLLLVAVIGLNRGLHQPMFLLLCSLFMNELNGSSAVFPFLLLQLLQDHHVMSHSFCFVQIFSLYTYANVELLTLAAMSYDRFVAICQPLQYHSHLSPQKTTRLVLGVWLFVLLEVSFMVSLSAPLRLCGNVIPKVYCDNFNVVKLACGDTTVNNVYGLLYTVLMLLCAPMLIVYTYVRIICVCVRGSRQTRHKALSTCGPHIVSLLNLAFGCFFEIVQSRFNMSFLPNDTRVFLSLYFLVCPPLLNPLIYGINLSQIRQGLKNLLLRKT